MADVFISYSSKDIDRIKPIVRELQSRSWSVWWDRELVVGPAYTDAIQNELDDAGCVVVAWSNDSINSPWCRDEASVGLERNRLVPFRIDDVQPPLGFRSSHTADLSGWPHREGELHELLEGVAECLKVVLPIAAAPPTRAAAEASLLILPFKNSSSDHEQEYFAAGLVEDITTALSQIPELMVISRSTAFEFKESKTSPDEIARRLNVKFALTGSVRKSGGRVRVSAMLLDALSARTMWSRSFDRDLIDIFEVQDELTREIVTALDVELVHGEHARLVGFRLHSPEALQELYKGMFEFIKFERPSLALARRHFERFVELEPGSPLGYAWLTSSWGAALAVQWEEPQVALPKMKEYATTALAIDPSNTAALIGNSYFAAMTGELDKALEFAKRAVEFGPNSDEAFFARGYSEMLLGMNEQAILDLEKSLRLSPIPPTIRLGVAATAYRNAGQFQDSVRMWKKLIGRFPDFIFGYSGLASTYALMEDFESAKEMVKEVLKRDPDYRVERFTNPNFYRDKSVLAHVSTALRKAGMPAD